MTRAQQAILGLARRITVAAVILAPWLFGCSEPWAYLSVSLLVLAGAAVWLFGLIAYPDSRIRAPAVALPLLLLVGFQVLQSMRWPAATVARLNPAAAEAVRRQVERFEADGVADFLPGGPARADATAPLSVAPGATRRSALLLSAYLAAFLVGAHTVRGWGHARWTARALVANGFALALVSLLHHFSGAERLLWVYKPRFMGSAFGPFTNRNHLAGHLLLLFGLAVGLLLAFRQERRMAGTDWKERVSGVAGREASQRALHVFAAALIGGTLAFTLSRGALLSLMAAAAAGLLALARDPSRRRMLASAGGVLLLATAVIAWLGWQPVVDRLATLAETARDPAADARVLATRDTLVLFGGFPLFGCGFGAFQHAFPTVQSPALQFGRWLHAHNDWAQVLAEGGVAGGTLAFAAAALYALHLARARGGGEPRLRLLLGGACLGLLAVAIHGFLDYSLRKPANALLLAFVAGVAAAASHILQRGRAGADAAADPDDPPLPVPGWRAPALVRPAALLALLLLLPLFSGIGRALRAELAFVRFDFTRKAIEEADAPQGGVALLADADRDAEVAMAFAPDHPVLMRDLAARYVTLAADTRLPMDERLHLAERAIHCAALGVRAAPTDALAWLWLARGFALVGRTEAVAGCLRRAQELRPGAVAELSPKRDG